MTEPLKAMSEVAVGLSTGLYSGTSFMEGIGYTYVLCAEVHAALCAVGNYLASQQIGPIIV